MTADRRAQLASNLRDLASLIGRAADQGSDPELAKAAQKVADAADIVGGVA